MYKWLPLFEHCYPYNLIVARLYRGIAVVNFRIILSATVVDQRPTFLPGNMGLITPSDAKSRRAVSNSASSSLRADTSDLLGAGKYSASMAHLTSHISMFPSQQKRILRCTCFWQYSLVKISLNVFCRAE